VRISRQAANPIRRLTVSLLLAALAGVATAPIASARTWPANPTAPFHLKGELFSVAATSTTNAWAVGQTGTTRSGTLTVNWNGKSWKRVPSPSPPQSALSGVAAASAHSAWAVGCTNCNTSGGKSLI
jgi:hypothetical protein